MSEGNDFLWKVIKGCASMGGDVAAIRAVGLTIAFFLLFFWVAWYCIKLFFGIFRFIFRLFSSKKPKQADEVAAQVVETVDEKVAAVEEKIEEVKNAPAEEAEPAAEETKAE